MRRWRSPSRAESGSARNSTFKSGGPPSRGPRAPSSDIDMKKLIVVVLILAAAVAGGWAWFGRGNAGTAYRVAKVDRGDLWVFVTATGAVQPVTQVQVGTQVTGTIEKLNADFNTRVKAGQVIAQ